jgi:RNA polymerase sigma-70 factor (ECF subfamily)
VEDKLKLLKEGNQQAFEEFVIEYRKEAVNFAANILKDYHIAEDIVQDSFAFIYVYRERIREYSTLKSYLFSIIHNRAIDYIRKNNRNITIDLDAISTFSPEEQILDKERRKSFIKSFNSLNEKYKVVLYLYGFQELSYKEISEVVGISLAQVKINIFRGRKKLKTLYNEEIDQ